MPETYDPQTWVDLSAATPISAARLAHLEAGIDTLDDRLTTLDDPTITTFGDANQTPAASAGTAVYMATAALTAERTFTLPDDPTVVRQIHVVRAAAATGAFDLVVKNHDATTLATLDAPDQTAHVIWNGTNWVMVGSGASVASVSALDVRVTDAETGLDGLAADVAAIHPANERTWVQTGNATSETGAVFKAPIAETLSFTGGGVDVSTKTAGDVVVTADLLKNGTTMFTGGTGRPLVAAGAKQASALAVPAVTDWVRGDEIQPQIVVATTGNPTYRDAATVGGGSTADVSTVAVPIPAGTVAGDLLVAYFTIQNQSTALTNLGSWAYLSGYPADTGDGNTYLHILEKIAGVGTDAQTFSLAATRRCVGATIAIQYPATITRRGVTVSHNYASNVANGAMTTDATTNDAAGANGLAVWSFAYRLATQSVTATGVGTQGTERVDVATANTAAVNNLGLHISTGSAGADGAAIGSSALTVSPTSQLRGTARVTVFAAQVLPTGVEIVVRSGVA